MKDKSHLYTTHGRALMEGVEYRKKRGGVGNVKRRKVVINYYERGNGEACWGGPKKGI